MGKSYLRPFVSALISIAYHISRSITLCGDILTVRLTSRLLQIYTSYRSQLFTWNRYSHWQSILMQPNAKLIWYCITVNIHFIVSGFVHLVLWDTHYEMLGLWLTNCQEKHRSVCLLGREMILKIHFFPFGTCIFGSKAECLSSCQRWRPFSPTCWFHSEKNNVQYWPSHYFP